MAKVFASVGGAFGYANKNTFRKPVLWVLVTVVAFLEIITAFLGVQYLAAAFNIVDVSSAFTEVLNLVGLGNLLTLFPSPSVGGLIAVGVVALIISLILGFFFMGLQIKIFAGKDVTFSGFFGTVGRGIQNFIISLIYQIIVIILTVALTIGLAGVSAIASPTGLAIALGVWAIVLVVLAIVFTIFMIPALINFAQQGKFGAAFHFKEIGKMIGQAKWYKILAGIIVIAIVTIILLLILCLIAGLICLIPGPARLILSIIFLSLAGVYIFFLESSFWAKLFAKAE